MFKRFIVLGLILIFSLSLTGCWGKKEMNEIGIVTVTGVDIETNGDIRITIMSVEPGGIPSITAVPASNAWIGTATGRSLRDASKNLRSVSSRKLVWYQNRLVLVGEGAAKAGVKNIIDLICRDREFRYNINILVIEGRAADIIQLPTDTETNISVHINNIIKNVDEWSKTYTADFRSFMVALSDKNQGAITGKLSYYKTTRLPVSTDITENEKMYWRNSKKDVVFMNGSAVFRQDKLAGWMNTEETRGTMWIANKIISTAIVAKSLDGKDIWSFETEGIKTEVSPEIKNNKLSINIKLQVKGWLVEQTDNTDIRNRADAKRVEKAVSAVIIGEMAAAVKKAQKNYNSDIFGFGGCIYRKRPEVWRKIEKDWSRIFPDMEVKYDVKVTLTRFGEATGTINNISVLDSK